MAMITREQALCMLHCAPYNNENAKKYAQMVDNLKNLEICYMENPMEPILTSLKMIEANSSKYHTYLSVANNAGKKHDLNLSI
jgi:hypothetical protein